MSKLSIQKDNNDDKMKVQFVSTIGTMGREKYHIIIPKKKHEDIQKLLTKQVRVTIDDEIFD